MATHVLETKAVDQALAELPGWRREGEMLNKSFEFGSFREAMSFMVRVGFEAEALNHHPEWTNVYDRVDVRLTTHHAGDRLTEKDLQLARAIEKINWVR